MPKEEKEEKPPEIPKEESAPWRDFWKKRGSPRKKKPGVSRLFS
jgi:hypothetical protein